MLFKSEIGFNLWYFYDLLGFLLLLYIPAMGGYCALETAWEVKGLFRKLNQENQAVSRLFFCVGDIYHCLKCAYFSLLLSEY